ncbi:MAG: multicopper oxidase domain-containing protein [Candidatus Bathyarchaeia archaeon]
MVVSVFTVPFAFNYYQNHLYPKDRTIYVVARQWEFVPGTKEPIVVKQGTLVRLLITSEDVAHGFMIDGYNLTVILTNGSRYNVTDVVLYAGEPVLVEFFADKPGTFWIRCNVQCHPVMHWYHRGRLIVRNQTA